jgi:hypothetical protein
MKVYTCYLTEGSSDVYDVLLVDARVFPLRLTEVDSLMPNVYFFHYWLDPVLPDGLGQLPQRKVLITVILTTMSGTEA